MPNFMKIPQTAQTLILCHGGRGVHTSSFLLRIECV